MVEPASDTGADPARTAAASEVAAERGLPPGYDDPARRPRTSDDPGAPLFWFLLLLGAVAIASVHELAATQPAAYLDPGIFVERGLVTGAALLSFAVAAFAVGRLHPQRAWLLPWLLAAASLALSASGYVWLLAFGSARWFPIAAFLVPAIGGALLGALLATAIRAFGRAALALGAIERLLDPLRIGMLAVAFGILAAVATAVGLLRSAAAIGLMLAVLAVWSRALLGFLERRAVPFAGGARLSAGAALVAGFLALLGAEAFVPSVELGRHNNQIVYFARSERASFVLTSGQDAFELYVDGRLSLSGIDERRYHEALVHPAMLAAPRRQRVLVLGQGHGATLRELFRHADVEHVSLVVVDRALPELAQRVVWLRQLGGSAWSSEKLEIVEQEPAVWLAEARGPFDVAIVDLPDPTTYLEAKNYSRYFYRRLAAALTPDGVLVVQATSPFGSPLTFATIERTLQAAELSTRAYRAAVPTFGDWGFVLASRRSIALPGAELDRFVSGTTHLEAFVLPADMRVTVDVTQSTLHDPTVMHTFADERERLGL